MYSLSYLKQVKAAIFFKKCENKFRRKDNLSKKLQITAKTWQIENLCK